jgi:nucleotide-binding universal stress UspA family protein
MFTHILVAIDLEGSSARALEVAEGLALKLGARLTLMHATAVPPMVFESSVEAAGDLVTPVEDGAAHELRKLVTTRRGHGLRVDAVIRPEAPVEAVTAAVRETGADLVIVGTHGRHGVERLLLGSVAEVLLRQSPVPVLVVRQSPPQS